MTIVLSQLNRPRYNAEIAKTCFSYSDETEIFDTPNHPLNLEIRQKYTNLKVCIFIAQIYFIWYAKIYRKVSSAYRMWITP